MLEYCSGKKIGNGLFSKLRSEYKKQLDEIGTYRSQGKPINVTQERLNDLKNQSNPNVRVFLVGNKSDLENQRKVSAEEGKALADKNNMLFF